LLRRLKTLRPDLPVLLMTGYATVHDAVEAMKLGRGGLCDEAVLSARS